MKMRSGIQFVVALRLSCLDNILSLLFSARKCMERNHDMILNRGPAALWLGRHGFAGVSEANLKKLAHDYDVFLEMEPSEPHYKEALCLALTLRFLDDITQQQAVQIMYDSHLEEDRPLEDSIGDLSDDVIWDFSLAGEQQEVMSMLKDWVHKKQVRESTRDNVKKAVQSVYKQSHAAAEKGKRLTQSKKAAKELASKKAAWLRELSARAEEVVLRDAPPRAHIFVDHGNGCYRVKMPWTKVKSFSWTKRGEDMAARLALRQLWDWHEGKEGEPAPAHLDL